MRQKFPVVLMGAEQRPIKHRPVSEDPYRKFVDIYMVQIVAQFFATKGWQWTTSYHYYSKLILILGSL